MKRDIIQLTEPITITFPAGTQGYLDNNKLHLFTELYTNHDGSVIAKFTEVPIPESRPICLITEQRDLKQKLEELVEKIATIIQPKHNGKAAIRQAIELTAPFDINLNSAKTFCQKAGY